MLRAPPLRSAALPPPPDTSLPRSKRSLQLAIDGCGALLQRMQEGGLFARYKLQLGLGSGTDLFDEGDWQARAPCGRVRDARRVGSSLWRAVQFGAGAGRWGGRAAARARDAQIPLFLGRRAAPPRG
eukprot:4692852-Prymnesium_polylepis.1